MPIWNRLFVNPTFQAAENGTAGENPMASNKSSLKDFLASIATMTGDLSNITAPPFVLDTKSVVEIPAFWAENPEVFCSPASKEHPEERALLILKSFLAGMKSQCYMGHSEEEGVKKPLNAFLGELFLGHWEHEKLGTTYLCSEQVSHHPPITACRVWNPEHGVIAEGYNRQKVTFSWSSMQVNISSTGFALKTLEKYNEHYLLPLPDFKVKGVLSGAPYPEVEGEFFIPSTNGYISKIDFSGKSFLGSGKKHGFHAVLYKEEDGPKKPIYTVEGTWNSHFTIVDNRTNKEIDSFDIAHAVKTLPELKLPPVEQMDPWESRRAWHDTQEAIRRNDFKGVSAAKSFLEQGQRNMRKEEEKTGKTWKPVFFSSEKNNEIVEKLSSKIPGKNFANTLQDTNGVWKFDMDAYESTPRPFHEGLEPDNLKEGDERVYRNGSRASIQVSRDNTPRGSIDYGSGTPRSRRSSVDLNGINGEHRKSRPQIDRHITELDETELDRKLAAEQTEDDRQQEDAYRRSEEHKQSEASQTWLRNPFAKKAEPVKNTEPVKNSEPQGNEVDERIGAVEDGRPTNINGTLVDVGRQPDRQDINGITKDQPGPQTNQRRTKEEEQIESGVDGLNLKEKIATEDMLRDMYKSSS